MEDLLTLKGLLGLFLLTLVELVLVVDNALVVILQCKPLPAHERKWVERLGLIQGAIIRIVLLTLLSWLTALTAPIEFFETTLGMHISWNEVISLVGGLILMWIAIKHYNELGHHHHHMRSRKVPSPTLVLIQILGVNLIFSLDSVLSAIGTVDSYPIMIAAVLISVLVLLTAVGRISKVIESNPNLKVFALSLVFLIGGFLFAEGLGAHIEKGQLYAAMSFGLFVQLAYMRKRARLYADPETRERIEPLTEALSEAESL